MLGLLFLGCNTEQMQDIMGASNLNSLGVVQGVVQNTSLRQSINSVSSSVSTSSVSGFLDIGVLTEEGVLLKISP